MIITTVVLKGTLNAPKLYLLKVPEKSANNETSCHKSTVMIHFV